MPSFPPIGDPGRQRRRVYLNLAIGLLVAVIGAATLWYGLSELRSGHVTVASIQSPSQTPGPSHATAVSPSPAHAPSPVSTRKPTPTPAPGHTAGPPHVMLIVEENNSYADVIGNPQLPYINSLAKKYGLATNWWALAHPSLPNYLAMISGSIWDSPVDTTPQQKTYSGPTLVDELAAKHVGWKAYLEDMPVACDLKDTFSPGAYDVNHNPFMYFTSIRNNPAQCNRVVPFTRFAGDLAANTAPPFLYVAPNTNNDMHNGTYAMADGWLKAQLAKVFASRWYAEGGVVILTWDEGESHGQRIATIVIAADHHGAPLGSFGNHFGLLRALEQTYGVSLLRNSANAANGNLKPLF